ncbi:MAG: DNA methyltransferase [Candidatus Pacearchaeota archaeon]|nr:DNA methyltransferase [Candidatus Pacearchaeota archaeon]
MEYIFILGRNPELSILELQSFFGNFVYARNKNAILAELPVLKKGIISRFGGVIAIGEVLADEVNLNKKIGGLSLYYTSKNKLNYVIWDFTNKIEFFDNVKERLKAKFKEERLKATEKKIANFMKLQSGEEIRTLSSHKLVEEQYFVFENKFGRIIETCDYEELERIDMEKPVRRESLSISPRLAKIMINLSKVSSGEVLVDPFCGIGVILQEALRLGINVVGIDKDPKAIEGIKANLKWGKFSEENYRVINGNSTIVKIKKSKAMVTEPHLGEILKSLPDKEKSALMLKEYEDLMIKVLRNFTENIFGRFVFTAPFIKTATRAGIKRIGCNSNRIINNTGLRLAEGFPIQEFRENQIVGREIFVLEH